MGALACLLFLYAASATFAPGWAVLVMLAVWVVLFVLACRWFMPHPRRVLWVAVGGAALWFVFAVGGGIALDW
jgi:hypothetical protein